MPKTVDVPSELREFNKIFERIAYRHGWGEVYRDFVDYATACLLWEGDKEFGNQLSQKYGKEYESFKLLFFEWMMVQKSQLGEDSTDWYDTLGSFYELVSSYQKASYLGQFFTPPDLVTMMTQITGGEKGGKKRMMDCCSGSGRMLIAYHANYPGNYTFGADIDPICTKMTALNMALHGCEGQAVCMDSLNPADWRFGYAINPYIRVTGGLPHIVPIQKEQCYQWKHWELKRQEFEQKQQEEKAKPIRALEVPVVGKFGQLSFF